MEHQLTKILITVFTYPVPSSKYNELVCTAGMTESGDWVRLYPVTYRYMPPAKRYRKWQWVEVATRPPRNDKRKESRTPDIDTFRLLGEPLGTKDNWRERRQIIDKLPHHTVAQLEELFDKDRTSLGIVRPQKFIDFVYEPVDEEWNEKQLSALRQLRLFDEQPKNDLKKIPYKFSIHFKCEDGQEYKRMIEDWETGMLFLNARQHSRSDKEAAEKVRQKYMDEVFAENRDARLFMGTTHPYNTWIVVGVFWPPRVNQLEFDF